MAIAELYTAVQAVKADVASVEASVETAATTLSAVGTDAAHSGAHTIGFHDEGGLVGANNVEDALTALAGGTGPVVSGAMLVDLGAPHKGNRRRYTRFVCR